MPLTNLITELKSPFLDDGELLYTESFGSVTRRMLVDASCRAGSFLRSLGCHVGSVVCICADDRLGTVLAILGSWSVGAVPALVHHGLTNPELEFVAADCDAALIVVDDERPASSLYKRSNVINVSDFERLVGVEGDELERYVWGDDQDQIVLIQYTSGSTGRPKGVVHKRSGLLGMIDTTAPLYGLRRGDRVLSAAKISFGYGLGNTIVLPWISGAASCLIERDVNVFSYMEAVRRWNPTVLAAVPRLWAAIVRALDRGRHIDLGSVRLGISAGEFLPKQLADEVSKNFGVDVIDGFGGTEVLHIVMARRPDQRCSFPLKGIEVSLRDEYGAIFTGTPSVGRLHVKGKMVADGYLNREAEEIEVFADSGVYTGDLCERTLDGGYRWISRRDDMLLLGGFRVSAYEIESVIKTTSHVSECAVVSRMRDDGLQDAVAYVVADGSVDEITCVRLVRRAVIDGLTPEKRPHFIKVVDELPVTSTGKLARSKIRDLNGGSEALSGLRVNVLSPGGDTPSKNLLVIPCAGGTSVSYERMRTALPDDVRLMSADLDSKVPETFDELVGRWLMLIESLLSPGDVLIGHSFGSAIITALTEMDSSVMNTLHIVLAAPAVSLPSRDTGNINDWMYEHGLMSKKQFENIEIRDVISSRFLRDVELLDEKWSPHFPQDREVLVVVGDKDRLYTPNMIRDLHHMSGRHAVEVLAECDHNFLINDSERFVHLLKDRGIL